MTTVNKDYIVNGISYNVNNIWKFIDKDYWDDDDLNLNFWHRLQRHNQIFYEVMRINNVKFGNHNNKYQDNTKALLDKMTEANKDYNIEIIWEDED